jgi:hypothetical protein
MKHGRRDANHVDAGKLAREHGFTTFDLGDAGDGCADWLWGKHGLNFWVELKRDVKAKLKPKQVELSMTWRGQWVRADSPEDAVALAEAYVAAFTRTAEQNVGWNARPSLSAETVASAARPRTGRRAYQGRARGRRRGR